jgi:hypothetical protein
MWLPCPPQKKKKKKKKKKEETLPVCYLPLKLILATDSNYSTRLKRTAKTTGYKLSCQKPQYNKQQNFSEPPTMGIHI